MAAALQDLLYPQTILKVVSRIKKGQGRLGKWFGFHYGLDATERGTLIGPNSQEVPVRSGTYRIFDRTRTVTRGRAPGTGPATVAPQPIGEVNYTCVRGHEKVPMEYESLAQMAKVAGPSSMIDAGGQQYLTMQEGFLAQRCNNMIEVATAGMIRGKWYLKAVGEDWIPVLTQPSAGTPFVTIDHKVPAGNLGQLDMMGTGAIIDVSWANPAAKIISKHLPGIADAYVALTGVAITDVWVDPFTWGSVITNTEVINSAGSANQPFEKMEYVGERRSDGQVVEWVSVLRGYPTIRWHIISDRLVLDGTDPTYAAGTGTLTPVIPTGAALFMGEVDPDWVTLLHYGEMITTAPGMPAVKRPSYFLWSEYATQPSVVELISLINIMPALFIPRALALGQVIFP